MSLIIQGNDKKFWNSDVRLAAISHLISSLDFNYDLDADYDVFQKYMLAILDSIGNTINQVAPYDEDRNIEVVNNFIEYALDSNIIVIEAEQEGLIDRKEVDMDFEY